MPHENFYDLGKDPKKLNDVGREDKITYPSVYDINPDNFPPLKDMKLGDTGEAMIHFRIRGSGIEVTEIKSMGAMNPESEKLAKDKETLLKRHKKNQLKMAGGESSVEGEGY